MYEKALKLLLVYVVYTVQASPPRPNFQMAGGETAKIEEAPYYGRYGRKDKFDAGYCSVTIVHEQFVVTVANCLLSFNSDEECEVKVGTDKEAEGEIYKVDSVHNHPKFDHKKYDYSIAVIKLSKKLQLSKKVQPIKMAEVNAEYTVGEPFVLFGISETEEHIISPNLQKLPVTLYNSKKCQEFDKFLVVTDRYICVEAAQGTGICDRDFGDPVVKNDTLVGMVAFYGLGCPSVVPPMVTKIAAVRPFIEDVLNNKNTIV